ncbi:S53 family peptidase [Curtobacterium ammoniigenes]|uniref:S53 family peptidase n=1 Tax=Curtobacterium ammoniigenes TaxID=395387 RepID=UPI00082B1B8C|nr:S53 family peptidase [Curtobacterium ammoniigenes]
MTEPTPDAPLDLVPVPGSDRPAAPGVTPAAAPLAADARVSVTLVLRRREPLDPAAVTGPVDEREFRTRFGADPADVDRVVETLRSLGLDVVDADAGRRTVRVEGPVATLQRVFGTSLALVTSDGPSGERVTHRHRTGSLSVPRVLDGIVVAVLGLDDRPQARAHFRPAASSAATSYSPIDLGAAYGFPVGTDGSGQTVAIIELGGGYEQQDLTTYFSGLGVADPVVTAVGVDGATNVPGGDPSGADGEVMLDIEVVGALAPGAAIDVYFAPNTDAGFVDAVSTAAHRSPAPTAMSISWGQSEDAWTASGRAALDAALADAVVLGTTVTVAAGDNGSADGQSAGAPHVDFPASSPHALACGGTRLRLAGTTIAQETVWNDGSGGGATGGGVSDTFAVPAWQQAVGVPNRAGGGSGRGVPDVAGDADPQTGYRVLVDGSSMVIGGTSAVAPLWAALIARLAQATGRHLGAVQPALYASAAAGAAAPGFRDITSGSNGAYSAGPGWDPCTGLGSPNGTALLQLLQSGHSPSGS